eukprot:gene34873-39433_t
MKIPVVAGPRPGSRLADTPAVGTFGLLSCASLVKRNSGLIEGT